MLDDEIAKCPVNSLRQTEVKRDDRPTQWCLGSSPPIWRTRWTDPFRIIPWVGGPWHHMFTSTDTCRSKDFCGT